MSCNNFLWESFYRWTSGSIDHHCEQFWLSISHQTTRNELCLHLDHLIMWKVNRRFQLLPNIEQKMAQRVLSQQQHHATFQTVFFRVGHAYFNTPSHILLVLQQQPLPWKQARPVSPQYNKGGTMLHNWACVWPRNDKGVSSCSVPKRLVSVRRET